MIQVDLPRHAQHFVTADPFDIAQVSRCLLPASQLLEKVEVELLYVVWYAAAETAAHLMSHID